MPLPDKGPAPYAPGKGVMGFIDHVREKGIPDQINQEYLGRIIDIGDSYARRTLRALEQLDLVDPESGRATPTLEKIKVEGSDQLQDTLAAWFQEAYKPILNHVSPSDDIETITNQFRYYTPDGQRDGMVRLFLHIAKDAGFIDEVPNRPRGATASTQPKKPKTKKVEKKEKSRSRRDSGPPTSTAKERYLDLLMELAEKSNGKPDDDLLDRIERVLGVPKQEVSA